MAIDRDLSRSRPREILPMLYGLAGVSPPAPAPGSDYPGYPLVAIDRWRFPGFSSASHSVSPRLVVESTLTETTRSTIMKEVPS